MSNSPETSNSRSWIHSPDLSSIRHELGGMVENFLGDTLPRLRGELQPPVDLLENDQLFVLVADVPGLTTEELSFELTEKKAILSVHRRPQSAILANERELRRERRHADFVREVSFPSLVNVKDASAVLENGVLTIRVPKKLVESRHQVTIQTETNTLPKSVQVETSSSDSQHQSKQHQSEV